jgi:hypothetical protein
MQPPQVVQAVPPPDSPGVPPTSPVILFMADVFDGVTFEVKAYSPSGTVDYGPNIVDIRLTTATKKDIYVLATKQPYPLGSSVVVTLGGTVTGTLVFNVASQAPPAPTGSLGFEPKTAASTPGSPFHALPVGWVGFGDTGVVAAPLVSTSPAGGPKNALPSEGAQWAALSTGQILGGKSVNGQASLLESGPIAGSFQTLTFDYDFHSAELPTYCGGLYDDTLVAVVSGPGGAFAKIVDSVNLVCAAHGASPNVPGMLPSETLDGTMVGDGSGASTMFGQYGSGRTSFSIPASVGGTAYLAFAITNVKDTAFQSTAGLDNLVLK